MRHQKGIAISISPRYTANTLAMTTRNRLIGIEDYLTDYPPNRRLRHLPCVSRDSSKSKLGCCTGLVIHRMGGCCTSPASAGIARRAGLAVVQALVIHRMGGCCTSPASAGIAQAPASAGTSIPTKRPKGQPFAGASENGSSRYRPLLFHFLRSVHFAWPEPYRQRKHWRTAHYDLASTPATLVKISANLSVVGSVAVQ